MLKFQYIIGFIFIFVALFLFAGWRFGKTTNISLTDLRWERPPSFVAVEGIQREKQTGLLFVRLNDGKEQFLAGTWHVAFSESGAYAYGSFPKGYSKEDGQHIYYLSGDGRIYHIQLADASLPITYIQEDPDTNYLFIEVTREHGRSFCVIPRLNEDKPSCQQLDVNGISNGLWNPAKAHELVIKTTTGQIFTFDPWEKKPHLIDPTDNQYQELTKLFTNQPNTLTQKPLTIRLLSLLIIKQNKSWHFVHIPIFAKIEWLQDWAHLIVVNRNNLSILEPFTKKEAPLKQERAISEHPVFIRSNGFDRKLQ